jgi:N6-L-threonylcarbamoyladenine synthase
MLVLAIETSCDDTGVSLLDYNSEKVVSEIVSSQDFLHVDYNGVVPEIAARAHLATLPELYRKVLTDSKVSESEIVLVAATRGPGLKGCLLIGYNYALGIATALNAPFIGVNHLEGHLLSPFITNPEVDFPFLALIVSGGHTELILAEKLGVYKILTKTIDDAVGEAFDKSATLLGLDYPGGAKLAKLADSIDNSPYVLPQVMTERPEMSFSGLKTAIARLINNVAIANKELPTNSSSIRINKGYLTPRQQQELAFAVQNSIIKNLLFKIKKFIAAEHLINLPLVVAGGVAANRLLRSELNNLNISVTFAEQRYCSDNATMIGCAAIKRHKMFNEGVSPSLAKEVASRWPLDIVDPL